MKKFKILALFLVLFGSVSVFGQKNVSKSSAGYYLSLSRPICCFLSTRTQNAAVKRLKANGITVSFGYPNLVEHNGNFPTARNIDRKNKVLLVGPFATESEALRVLNRLPNILPKDEDMDFSIRRNPPYGWNIGLYDIMGFKIK